MFVCVCVCLLVQDSSVGVKITGNELSTSASSQEQVLSNQTLNKHTCTGTLVQSMTHPLLLSAM